jgi:hypothetical protein
LSGRPFTRKIAGDLGDLTQEERATVIRAAVKRIWLDRNNEIEF